MKPIKMLGLAALAALLAMAFFGTSSAMAESTELCGLDPGTESTQQCPGHTEAITHVHETTEAASAGVLLSVVKVECEVLFLGDTVGASGAPLEIKGKFTYASCKTTSGTTCTVTETSEGSIIKVLRTAHELGELTREGEVNVHCGFFINCTYDGQGLSGHVLGPLLSTSTNGQVRFEEQTTHKVGGILCPESAKLDLLTAPLEPIYLGKGGAAHSCVEYEHAGHGFYEDNACTIRSATRNKNYELVVGAGNSGECYFQRLDPKGLWKTFNAAFECKEDDGTNSSRFEKVK